MTLSDLESVLATRGLRLTRAIRIGKVRRHFVEARSGAETVAGMGIALEDAVGNLIEAWDSRRKRGTRRFQS